MKERAGNKPFLRYCGFAARDYLILKHLPLDKEITVLDIGVGLGSIVDKLIGRVKEYCGVDIANELINHLTFLYRHVKSASWYCLDACKDSPFLLKNLMLFFPPIP